MSENSGTKTVLLFATLAFVSLVLRMSSHAVSPNFNTSSEANGLYGSLNFGAGHSLYASRGERPYHIYLYGPLHGWVNGGVLRLTQFFGPKLPLFTRVVLIRSFSLLCFLGILILLWKTHWRKHFEPEYLLLLVPLIFSRFSDYATTARNDSFSLLWETCAVLSFIRHLRTERAAKWFYLFLACAFAAFLTRPTGGVLLLSAGLYFLWQRNFKQLGMVVLSGLVFLASYFLLNVLTKGAFFDGVLYANLRGFRPINRQFFDASLLSFLFLYAPFFALVLWGLRKPLSQSWEKFLVVYFFGSLALAFSTFLRAGGDVNYFFPAILAGIYFATEPLKHLLQTKLKYALCIQLIAVAFVYSYKTAVSTARSNVPFQEAAEMLRKEYPKYIYFGGGWAANMGIYLPDRIYHGPDVTDTGQVARNAHESLRWIITDFDQAIHDKEISVAIWVDPHCKKWKRFYSNLGLKTGTFAAYDQLKMPYHWMCIFERNQNPEAVPTWSGK